MSIDSAAKHWLSALRELVILDISLDDWQYTFILYIFFPYLEDWHHANFINEKTNVT